MILLLRLILIWKLLLLLILLLLLLALLMLLSSFMFISSLILLILLLLWLLLVIPLVWNLSSKLKYDLLRFIGLVLLIYINVTRIPIPIPMTAILPKIIISVEFDFLSFLFNTSSISSLVHILNSFWASASDNSLSLFNITVLQEWGS